MFPGFRRSKDQNSDPFVGTRRLSVSPSKASPRCSLGQRGGVPRLQARGIEQWGGRLDLDPGARGRDGLRKLRSIGPDAGEAVARAPSQERALDQIAGGVADLVVEEAGDGVVVALEQRFAGASISSPVIAR